jgi:hypothetical protein
LLYLVTLMLKDPTPLRIKVSPKRKKKNGGDPLQDHFGRC